MPLLTGSRRIGKAELTRADGITMTAAEMRAAQIYTTACKAFADGSKEAVTGTSVRESLRQADVDGALLFFPWSSFQSALSSMATPLTSAATTAGANIPTTGMGTWRFDATDPRVYEFTRTQSANLVTYISNEQRDLLRGVLTQAVVDQTDVRNLGPQIAAMIGLTPRMAKTANNAWDTEYQRAIAAGASRAEADAAAAKAAKVVSDRLRQSRGMTIARTETMRAQNAARYIGWAQAVESGQVSPDSRKKWRTIPSGSMHGGPCDICAPMNGLIIKWDEVFPNGVQMPPAHPNCRCTATMLPPDRAKPATTEPSVVPTAPPQLPVAPPPAQIVEQPIDTTPPKPVDRVTPLDFSVPTPAMPEYVSIDVSEVDNEAKDMVTDTVARLADRFPEMGDDPRSLYVGGQNWIAYMEQLYSGRAPSIPTGAHAWAWHKGYNSYISVGSGSFGPGRYADGNLLKKHAKDTGWSAVGDLRGTVIHEFGHTLLYRAEEAISSGTLWWQIEKALQAAGYSGRLDSFKKSISEYATTSRHELFAEAFAKVMTEEDPGEEAKIIVKTVIDFIESLKGGS